MKAKMVVNSVAALLAFTASCGIASAKNCKDVTVKVVNNFTHAGNKLQIKVVDMDFWDNNDAKWREEFGVKNIVVAPDGGSSKVGTRDFEHVGGEKGVRVAGAIQVLVREQRRLERNSKCRVRYLSPVTRMARTM